MSQTVKVCFAAPEEVLAGSETVTVFAVSDVIGVMIPVIPVSDRTSREAAVDRSVPATVRVTLPPEYGRLAGTADIPLTDGTAGKYVLLDE